MLLKTTSVIRITYYLSGANLYCVCRLAQFIYFIDPSFTRHIQFVLFLTFVFSCKTAPYMTFTLIFFKQFLDLLIELWRELWKSVSQIFMYCGLADSTNSRAVARTVALWLSIYSPSMTERSFSV